jgi:DNA-directed RNA polymerase I, II, and III subunit RPABC2
MSDYEDYDSDASKSSSDDEDIIVNPSIREKKILKTANQGGEAKEGSDDESEKESANSGGEDDDDDEFADDDSFLENDDDDIEIDEDGIFQEKKKKATNSYSNKKEDNLDEYGETNNDILDHLDDVNDSDDETNEFYLQKFNSQMRQNAIENFHPELQQHNMDEIEALCVVVRDERGNVIDPLHRTLPFLTKYEKARILGERTVQLNNGAKPFVEVNAEVVDGYLIALDELAQKKIPFIVKRPLPNGGCEYWKLSDLEIL